jgi:hypothetical protein
MDLDTRLTQFSSDIYLTKQLPDNFKELSREELLNFVSDNINDLFEDYTPVFVYEMILENKCIFQRVVNTITNKIDKKLVEKALNDELSLDFTDLSTASLLEDSSNENITTKPVTKYFNEMIKEYEELTENNQHTEALIVVAEFLGLTEEIEELKDIEKESKKLGGLSIHLHRRKEELRYKINNELLEGNIIFRA